MPKKSTTAESKAKAKAEAKQAAEQAAAAALIVSDIVRPIITILVTATARCIGPDLDREPDDPALTDAVYAAALAKLNTDATNDVDMQAAILIRMLDAAVQAETRRDVLTYVRRILAERAGTKPAESQPFALPPVSRWYYRPNANGTQTLVRV